MIWKMPSGEIYLATVKAWECMYANEDLVGILRYLVSMWGAFDSTRLPFDN